MSGAFSSYVNVRTKRLIHRLSREQQFRGHHLNQADYKLSIVYPNIIAESFSFSHVFLCSLCEIRLHYAV